MTSALVSEGFNFDSNTSLRSPSSGMTSFGNSISMKKENASRVVFSTKLRIKLRSLASSSSETRLLRAPPLLGPPLRKNTRFFTAACTTANLGVAEPNALLSPVAAFLRGSFNPVSNPPFPQRAPRWCLRVAAESGSRTTALCCDYRRRNRNLCRRWRRQNPEAYEARRRMPRNKAVCARPPRCSVRRAAP